MATSNGLVFLDPLTTGIQSSARKGLKLYQNSECSPRNRDSCRETGVALYDAAARPAARARRAFPGRHARGLRGVVPELASRDHNPASRAAHGRARARRAAPRRAGGIATPKAPSRRRAARRRLCHALGEALGARARHPPPRRAPALAAALRPAARFSFLALSSRAATRSHAGSTRWALPPARRDAGRRGGVAFDKRRSSSASATPAEALSALAERAFPAAISSRGPCWEARPGFQLLRAQDGRPARRTRRRSAAYPDIARGVRRMRWWRCWSRSACARCKMHGLRRLVVAGGVGANKQLRAALDSEARKRGFDCLLSRARALHRQRRHDRLRRRATPLRAARRPRHMRSP